MSFEMKMFFLALGVLAAVAVVIVPAVTALEATAGKREVALNNQTIIADVAATPAARERGLGGRDALEVNEGMLFLFDGSERYTFWMKGMYFPIDIVWIREGRIVSIAANVPPQIGAPESELARYTPPEPADTVLELAAGRAARMHAAVGDEVSVRPLIRWSLKFFP